ncbi:MAG: urea ABC transporter permease subunit UrtB [Oscillospiraceae bacterium]|jgi:urea transport system permease protein|nr:urea ABC transporter permease subunit UrtB [Oscillospiraceae bacterium]
MGVFWMQLINGLFASSVLLICALGMVIIFGNMNVVNLAHGEFIMTGAYVTWFMTDSLRLPFAAALIGAFLVAAVIGVVCEKLIMKRFYRRFEETLLATYALSVIMAQIARGLFSSMKKMVEIPVKGSLTVGGMVFPAYNFVIVAVAAAMVLLVCLLFYRTNFGKKIRAIKQNRQMAACIGIDTGVTDTLSFGLGCGLAGLAGAVIAPIKVISPVMGSAYLMDSFSTVVVGGVDSFLGTSFSSALISESGSLMSGYMNGIYAQILVLVGIILVLRFRPHGLFAKERR